MRALSVCLALFGAVVFVNGCVGDDPTPAAPVDAGPLADAEPGADGGGPPADSGADAPACAPGQTLCGSACVDTSSSPDHCGACDHACGGGTCTTGVCDPVAVATDVAEPRGVAAAAGTAFWYRAGAVESCPVAGCKTPKTITNQVTLDAFQPGGTTIVTDGNVVVWIASGNLNGRDVFACDAAGCANGFPPKKATGLTDAASQLAIEGSTLYVSQLSGTQRSGPVATLALAGIGGTGSDVPTGIAADKTNVYFAGVKDSAAGADACTLPSCMAATRLFADATYLAVSGSLLFATSTAGIVECAVTGCGGNPTPIFADDKTASAIAADDKFVVWAVPGSASAADGAVRACALPDCKGGPRTIASAQARPVSVAVSGGFVYWANRGVGAGAGSIWRAAL